MQLDKNRIRVRERREMAPLVRSPQPRLKMMTQIRRRRRRWCWSTLRSSMSCSRTGSMRRPPFMPPTVRKGSSEPRPPWLSSGVSKPHTISSYIICSSLQHAYILSHLIALCFLMCFTIKYFNSCTGRSSWSTYGYTGTNTWHQCLNCI